MSGRPLSKLTNAILALKAGQQHITPRGAKRATIASYVYNANLRDQRHNLIFRTKKVSVKGRSHIAVVAEPLHG